MLPKCWLSPSYRKLYLWSHVNGLFHSQFTFSPGSLILHLHLSKLKAHFRPCIHPSSTPAALCLPPALLSPLPHPHLFCTTVTSPFSLHTHSLLIGSLLCTLTSPSPPLCPVLALRPALILMVALSPPHTFFLILPCVLCEAISIHIDPIMSPHLEWFYFFTV